MKVSLVLLCIALLIIPSLSLPVNVGGTYGSNWLNNSGNKNIIRSSSGLWDYSNNYQTYNPAILNRAGTYTPPSNYLPTSTYYPPGSINPYLYDPQYELDLAIANHAYQKSLANYYSKIYRTYPWQNIPYRTRAPVSGIGYIGFSPGY